jgi:hypothetical protein
VLARQAQARATGRHDFQTRTRLEQRVEPSTGGQHVLEVVEDQKYALICQGLPQRLDHGAAADRAHPEHLGDRRQHQIRPLQRRQRHEPHAVLKCRTDVFGYRERQAGLASAGRTRERL